MLRKGVTECIARVKTMAWLWMPYKAFGQIPSAWVGLRLEVFTLQLKIENREAQPQSWSTTYLRLPRGINLEVFNNCQMFCPQSRRMACHLPQTVTARN